MRMDIYLHQINKVILSRWRDWRCGNKWETQKKLGLVSGVNHIVGH